MLLGVVARAPVRPWLARVLFVEVVGVTSLFAAVGLWEAHARELIFATRRIEVGTGTPMQASGALLTRDHRRRPRKSGRQGPEAATGSGTRLPGTVLRRRQG